MNLATFNFIVAKTIEHNRRTMIPSYNSRLVSSAVLLSIYLFCTSTAFIIKISPPSHSLSKKPLPQSNFQKSLSHKHLDTLNHCTNGHHIIITKATINFSGQATSEYEFINPSESGSDFSYHSLPRFLNNPACNTALLGGSPNRSIDMLKDHKNNIVWRVEQPTITILGSSLLSYFVSKIDRASMDDAKLIVSIVDATTEVIANDENSRTANSSASVIQKIMKRSSFLGDATYTWKKRAGNPDAWILKAHLNLVLKVDLPRFLLVPPGFNKIGSAIVNKTCKKQIEQSLKEMNIAYLEWVLNTEPVQTLKR